MIFLLDEHEFPNNYKNVVFYFYASWMPFHKKMLTMIDKMENKYNNLTFYAIDVDNLKKITKRFNIDSVPTVLIIIDGKEEKRINGLIMTSAFKSVFVDIYNLVNH